MKKNLLIIEDEATSKLLYREAFKNADFNILWASDGYTALELLKVNKVDVVVTDIYMPLIGGGAVISHLDLYHPEIPVIVVTAHPDDKILEDIHDSNIKAFFSKPVDLKTLQQTVAQLLL